jgi:nucleotide-binding universal stress UspA family protein
MDTEIDHILFPTDFSDSAENALTFAVEIASQTNATLHILHSIEEPYDFAPMEEEVKKNVTQKVSSLLHILEEDIRSEKKYKTLSIKTYIQTGRTAYAILDESTRHPVDLIVMGTKGRSRQGRLLLGSTTAEIIQEAEVPVLAVPEQAAFSGFDQILFATDYNDGDLKALEYVTRFADHFNSSITIFHASLEDDLKANIMFRGFRELVKEKIPFERILFEEGKNIVLFEAIADRVEKEKVSMVVMIRYKESFSFFGSNTKEMSYYIKAPFLVLPGDQLSGKKFHWG